jgi:GT2 family glycosyltransferase
VRLSVVIVTWNRSALLADCLESIERTQPERPEVVVVDNGSTDGTGELLASSFPWVEAIALERNAGFAQANNLGVAAAHGDVVLLLNDDTVLLEGVAPLLARFEDSSVGAVGPRLVGPDGDEQLSARGSFPTPASVLRDYLRPGRSDLHPATLAPVAWVAGAALFVRAETYRAVGGLDEGYFMFFEETELCRRLHARGAAILFDPSVSVRHLGGTAVGVPLFVERAYYESLFRYLRRDGQRGLVPLRILLALGAALRGLAALLRGRFATARRLRVAAAACLGLGGDARSRAAQT